jgi:fluoroquinolone transport system ATP-binding protein
MIEVRNLAFTYRGADAPAVRDLDFDVADGEILGFLGPSGAGKSTTQNVLIGLLRGYAGDVSVLGRNLADVGPDYYESIGVSFEFPNHFLKLTARENLAYFRSLYAGPTEEPEHLMDIVGLADAIDVRVAEYSKGMKHRLTFARSLLNRPRLWFLDEPTAGLDPVNARNIRDIIRDRQASGVTTFLTTHDMAVADDLSDRVAFIVDGRLEMVDTPTRLKHRFGRRTVRLEYVENDEHRQVEFDLDGLADDDAFQAILRDRRIETMHSQESTLEQVFIEATGRRLE